MASSLPAKYRKIVTKKLSPDFDEATEIVAVPLQQPKPDEVLIKTKFLGINATDINITAGRYLVADPTVPFDTGLEALGEVVAVGSEVKRFKVGQPVAYIGLGCFAEYICVPANHVWQLPKLDPEYLALLICGRTASIGLDKAGQIQKKDIVLITSAAGGTGTIAVQYAKALGCHVIGTCSSEEKVKFLKDLKCDRPINYRKEKLEDVLKEEYPNGVDVVWETVGGDTFKTALKNLAIRGRLVVIGFISNYKSEEGYHPMELGFLPRQLLSQSNTVTGFLLTHHYKEFPQYHAKLLEMHEAKQIKIFTDNGDKTTEGRFTGLESVRRAVKHLHSGTSRGKILVTM